jgi:Tfp pilus assembly protein PilF
VKAWCSVVFALGLAACASVPRTAPDAGLFEDAQFAPQAERISAEDVFAASPQMLEYIRTRIAPEQRSKGRQQGLFDALYLKGGLHLDYDASITRNAAEAFAARQGNCLSLVVMTAAFARQLQLPVRFQSVYTREAWSRGEGLDYLNGHVNIVLTPAGTRDRGELLIEFMAVPEQESQRIRVLRESSVVAMYMNNRAVELLARGELDRAYWWAKAAIAQDGSFLGATNTLAVIYKARGRLAESERALRWLLAIEPDNIVALDNLVRVLEAAQRPQEASALARRLQQLRPIAPFHYYDLGMEALKQQDFAQARDLFLKEMRRDAAYDRFHAALALAYYGLGDLPRAQEQMALALDYSTTSAEREMYAEKLARLRAGEHP